MEEWERRRLEATIQTAALCAYVDGHLAEEERDKMCECIAIHASNEEEARQLIALARDLPDRVAPPQSGFRAQQFQEIKAALRTPAERHHAFHLAVQVANAHRGIGVSETGFLLDLMHELEVEPNYARDVMAKVRELRRSQRP